MPVVIVLPISPTTTSIANTTVGDIVECAQQNLKHLLGPSGNPNILIAYTSDIHQQIMRKRRWEWALSPPQRFVTERGQSDYWLGVSAQAPYGSVYTGHALADIQNIDATSVRNLSTSTPLYAERSTPLDSAWQNADGSYKESLPHEFRNGRTTPHLLQLFPAPDTGTEYQIIPPAPVSVTVTSGALAARTYFLRTTFVDAAGNESLPSATARQWIAANKLIKVKTPVPQVSAGSAGITYNRYRVYASVTEGSETLQATVSLNVDWTEAGTGLTTNGAAVPDSATIDPLRGHLIEFKYWRKHVNFTSVDEVLIVPDEYADVMCAGVTWLGARYMKDYQFASEWERQFREGLVRMGQNEVAWEAPAFVGPDPGWI